MSDSRQSPPETTQAPPPFPAPPPGAYTTPVGGYPNVASGYAVPKSTAPQSKAPGIVALVTSLIIFIVSSIIAGVVGFQIGLGAPDAVPMLTGDEPISMSVLSPVRGEVLLAEISFWGSTILGVFAIITGIWAISARRGRGAGIAAVIIAIVAAATYLLIISFMIGFGSAVGTGTGPGGF